MKYLSVKEAAEIWNISERMVRKYCEQDRIESLFKRETFGLFRHQQNALPKSKWKKNLSPPLPSAWYINEARIITTASMSTSR